MLQLSDPRGEQLASAAIRGRRPVVLYTLSCDDPREYPAIIAATNTSVPGIARPTLTSAGPGQ